jgi:hypothetical protein
MKEGMGVYRVKLEESADVWEEVVCKSRRAASRESERGGWEEKREGELNVHFVCQVRGCFGCHLSGKERRWLSFQVMLLLC